MNTEEGILNTEHRTLNKELRSGVVARSISLQNYQGTYRK